jgi:hypothetical protein
MGIVSVVIKDVEVEASKVLTFLAKAEKATPGATAALGVILGAVSKSMSDVSLAANQSGLNISLDQQTLTDLKTVWPDVKAFAATLGIKL